MTSDDAFMMLAGVRYCLGRHSYAPSLCCDWLKTKWPEVRLQDRQQVIREIGRHIAEAREFGPASDTDIDLRTWQAFMTWAEAPSDAPSTPEADR